MASAWLERAISRRATESGADELLSLLKDPFATAIAQQSVWASLGTSVGFTLLLAICFSLLRPYNSVVYAPKLKIADDRHAPPPMGKGIFAWFAPVIKTKEHDLIQQIGLDATVFLRVLRMLRNIFVALAVIGCGILIPVNYVKGVQKGVDFVVRVTPLNTYGNANWAIVICAYLFNFTIAGFLWYNYGKVLALRREYYESAEYQNSLHARTLMINDIPKELRSDEGIGRLIDQVAPTSSFSRTAVARNVKDLPELIEEHSQAVRSLEQHLAKYLKNPDVLPPKRPECKPSKKDPSWGSYPKGQKVDAIEYLTNRIKSLELEIREVRLSIDNRNPLSYGFASYEEIEEAHSIAFAARKKHPKKTTIVLAPRPNDIIWKNMPLTPSQRRSRTIMNNIWVSLLTVLWIAPNAMISIFLVQLSNLGHVWPAFQDSLAAHTAWWSIIQGVASPAVSSLVYLVLPIIFRRMLNNAGDRTKTARECHVTAKLYTFFVVNFLVVFSLFSVIWSFVTSVIQNTQGGKKDVWSAIQDADIGLALFIKLCDISPFWITWLLQRNLGAAVDLAQLWTLVWSFCARKFSSPTPREMIELTAPPPFEYAAYYNYFLFYTTVTLCFGYLQPLCLPACAAYFVLDVYLKKYLLLYIFITKIESGGMFWRMFFNRMVFASILSNLIVFLAAWAQGDAAHMEAYVVIPLPFLMIGFKLLCKHTFDEKINYYQTRNRLKDPEATRDKYGKRDKLASRFGHPALYRPLITPMVHAKAQNKLAAVYGGRLTDSNNAASGESGSVSGYSDTYALDPMRSDKPGRKAAGGVPGFEMVPENKLDFEYFKGRAEFSDDHGGNGGIFGRAEDIVRTDTPGNQSAWGESESSSRPGTPVGGMIGRKPQIPYMAFDGAQGDIGVGGHNPVYGHRNDSQTNLVSSAAAMPQSPTMSSAGYASHAYRSSQDQSQERRAPGFLGGGPQGYGGLPQAEVEHDPASYDYFRGRRQG